MSAQLNVNIIDDEKDGRDYIALLLENEFPELKITFQAPSIQEAYPEFIKEFPDILFLDVELQDGNVFQLLSKFKEIPSQIIFITAYEQYALPAIKNAAVDYLLKPIKKSDFITAVKKALINIQKAKLLENKNLLSQAALNLPTTHGIKRVAITDIIRCEADSNYTIIYLADKTRVIVSQTLHEYEKILTDHDFVRVHHKHLINLRHVKEYVKMDASKVIMTNGSEIAVSVRKRMDFLKQYKNK